MMIRRNVTRASERAGGFPGLGFGSVPGADQRRPAGLDRRWLHDVARASVFAQRGLEGIGAFNYIRNSVKATVDAYDGTVHLYVFDPDDPLLQAYRNLFPALVRARLGHARGSAQARPLSGDDFRGAGRDLPAVPHARSEHVLQQVGRLGHRPNSPTSKARSPRQLSPTYVVATLPGENASRNSC